MILRALLPSIVMACLLAACASHAPAPVEDRSAAIAAAAAAEVPVEVPPGHYLVKKGDNLLRIALDHGQDYREVAVWNKLEDPNKINVGQVLRVVPPEGAAVAKPVTAPAAAEATTAVAASPVLKREPKGGKEPYSDEALARLQKPDAAATKTPEKVAEKPAEKAAEAASEKSAEAGDWAWPVAGKPTATFNEASNKGIDIAAKNGDPVTAAGAGKVVYAGSGLRGYGKLVIIKHDATFLTAYAHNSQILVKEGQSVTRGQKIAEVGSTDSDQPKLHFEIRRQGKPVDPLAYLPKR
ncbi:MAG TPA: peptidoglycan DD-metalloendopeptidase family protein [Rhodocyclaceae bacterium]